MPARTACCCTIRAFRAWSAQNAWSSTPRAGSTACWPTMPSAPILPRPDLVVCDLAGTTIYDRGEVPAAFEQALREAGLAFDAAEVSAWRGASKREVLGRLVARQDGGGSIEVERVYRRFRELLLHRLAE